MRASLTARKVVDAFAAHRPVCDDPAICGLRMFVAKTGDDCSMYVRAEMQHHVREALDEGTAVPEYALTWLSYYPRGLWSLQNEQREGIIAAVQRVVGLERLLESMRQAHAASEWWQAHCLFWAARDEIGRTEGWATMWDGSTYLDVIKVWLPISSPVNLITIALLQEFPGSSELTLSEGA